MSNKYEHRTDTGILIFFDRCINRQYGRLGELVGRDQLITLPDETPYLRKSVRFYQPVDICQRSYTKLNEKKTVIAIINEVKIMLDYGWKLGTNIFHWTTSNVRTFFDPSCSFNKSSFNGKIDKLNARLVAHDSKQGRYL